MKKKFSVFTLFAVLGLLSWWYSASENKSKEVNRTIAHAPLPKKTMAPVRDFDIKLVDASRRPATEPKPPRERERKISFVIEKAPPVSRAPQSPRYIATISRDLKIIADHYAIRQEEYTPSMGDVVFEFNNMIVVKAETRPQETAANVAYDEKDQTYHPVSSILKIRDVSEEKRQELIAQGFEEHFYHQQLKLMYIQGTHENIVKMYNEAKNQGYKADLEVIRDFHRPR